MSAPTKNLHDLFYRSSKDSLHNNILLTAPEDAALMAARETIRGRLRQALGIEMQRLAQDSHLVIYPKFYMQGSRAYETLIAPYRTPPQQADLDDGVYIPVSYAENKGSPKVASDIYTTSIENILGRLAQERGWHIDPSNDNCTRVVLSRRGEVANKHVDVPAYSIPDHQFSVLVERHLALNAQRREMFKADSAGALSFTEDDKWELMPTELVLLAHKKKGWHPSDPRPIRDWVFKQVTIKGEQLRRLIRYIKAWRDAQDWPKDDPKSILLMVAVDMALDVGVPNRDDLALWKVVKALPGILQGQVLNPTNKAEDLAKRLDEHGTRADLISRLQRLARVLERVLTDPHISDAEVYQILRGEFGIRFPGYTPDPKRSPIEVVRSYEPATIKSVPPVGNRTSG